MEYARQIFLASAVVISIALSAGLAVYFLQPPAESTLTISKMTSAIIPTTTTFVNSSIQITQSAGNSLGLRLELSINSTAVKPGQGMSVNISEYNALSTVNNASVSSNWPPQTMSVAACDETFPLRIGVANGYFTTNNISYIQPDQLVNFIDPNAIYLCPALPAAHFYNFQPRSDLASMCFASTDPSCYSPMAYTIRFNGSWIGGNNSVGTSAKLENLNPGSYTVVGGDEWGQIALLHFSVFSSSQGKGNHIKLQGFGLCAASCVYPAPRLGGLILFNASSPPKTLKLYVNGFLEDNESLSSDTNGSYGLGYNFGPDNRTTPIIAGRLYNITLEASFADGSSDSQSVMLVAFGPDMNENAASATSEGWFFGMTTYFVGNDTSRIAAGQDIQVYGNLTYVGTENETVDVAGLLLTGLIVFRIETNGTLTEVWAFQPPAVIFSRNVTYGTTFTDFLDISYNFQSGQRYEIVTQPSINVFSSISPLETTALNPTLRVAMNFTVS